MSRMSVDQAEISPHVAKGVANIGIFQIMGPNESRVEAEPSGERVAEYAPMAPRNLRREISWASVLFAISNTLVACSMKFSGSANKILRTDFQFNGCKGGFGRLGAIVRQHKAALRIEELSGCHFHEIGRAEIDVL